MINYYSAFGLTISSEIVCPFLSIATTNQSDVQILLCRYKLKLTNGQHLGHWCEARDNLVLLKIAGIADYLIEDGHVIKINPKTEDHSLINLFLTSSVFFILLRQRNLLAVHAASVIINNKAIVIAAPAGYGKSTLVAAFLQKGYSILTDDISTMKAVDNNFMVYPSFPYIKLCGIATAHLGYDKSLLKRVVPKADKFLFPLQQAFHHIATPLSHIFILNIKNHDDCTIVHLHGAKKLQALITQMHLSELVDLQNLAVQTFKNCQRLVQSVPVSEITRPEKGFSAFELVEKIVEDVNSL